MSGGGGGLLGVGVVKAWQVGGGVGVVTKLSPKTKLSYEDSSADDKSSLLNLPVTCTMVLKHMLKLNQVRTALTYLALAMFVLSEGWEGRPFQPVSCLPPSRPYARVEAKLTTSSPDVLNKLGQKDVYY